MNTQELNPEQRRAVLTTEGPLLILAGAGSGKTRTLTYRVAHLIEQGVPPWSILAITFTNKAAAEMKERIGRMVGREADEIWISTFHAACARILRRDIEKIGYSRSFTIYDDDDQMTVIKNCLKKLNIDEKAVPPRTVKTIISDAKNRLQSPEEWFAASERGFSQQRLMDLYTAYEAQLKTANALDFDDLLSKTLELFAACPPVLEAYQHRFRYIHVDEYQDTNYAQYMMIRLLAGEHRNLCVVGDDDQSIYGWRGADIRNILDFEKDFPDTTVIKLEQNYRSTANILDAANQVIARNENRKDKALWTEKEAGARIGYSCLSDDREEAAWVAGQCERLLGEGFSLSDIGILYRTNAQSRRMEETLVRSGLRYRIYGGLRFYERKEIKDILAYLRLLVNPADDVSLRRIINVPRRAIGDSTVEELARYATEQGIPLLTACMDIPDTLGSRAKKAVESFGKLMLSFSMALHTLTLSELTEKIIEDTGLEEQYQDGSDESMARIDNMKEFESAVAEYEEKTSEPNLIDFLENVALVSDLDGLDEKNGALTLMTLHSAKGLEFPCVFMIGMEENLFPTRRSMEDPEKAEEERRLCYVGITRAKSRLFLTCCRQRLLYNQIQYNDRSRFIEDIPARILEDLSPFARRPQQSGGIRMPRQASAPARAVSAGESIADWLRRAGGGSAGSGGKEVSRPIATENEQSKQTWTAGDRILHKRFGEGTILRVSSEGGQTHLLVRFDDAQYGAKQLIAEIAPILSA